MKKSASVSDRDDLANLGEFAISPSGDEIAFQLSGGAHSDGSGSEGSVYVRNATDERRTAPIGADARELKWSPDGRRIGYLQDGGVFSYDVSADTTVRVTDGSKRITGYDWGPSGERIVTVVLDDPEPASPQFGLSPDQFVETERLNHRAAQFGFDAPRRLETTRLHSGETVPLTESGRPGFQNFRDRMNPSWSRTGDIAYLANERDHPDRTETLDVFTVSPVSGANERVTNSDLRITEIEWSPTGDRLAFVGKQPRNRYRPSDLYVTDGTAEGAVESLTDDWDRPIHTVDWLSDDTLVCTTGDRGKLKGVIVDIKEGVGAQIDPFESDESLDLEIAAAGGRMAFKKQTPRKTTDLCTSLVTADGTVSAVERITDTNAEYFSQFEGPKTKKIRVEGAGGDELEAYVHFPPGADEERPEQYPCIFALRMGFSIYAVPKFSFDHYYWARENYAVVELNYHGSGSYGSDFSESVFGEDLSLEVTDVINCASEIRGRNWCESERMFLKGSSIGGTMAGQIVTETDMFSAAIADRSTHNFYGSFGATNLYTLHEAEWGTPWDDPDAFREMSVIEDVDRIDTPMLLIVSGRDQASPPSQSEQLHACLKLTDTPSKLLKYPDETHLIRDPDILKHKLHVETEWLDRFS